MSFGKHSNSFYFLKTKKKIAEGDTSNLGDISTLLDPDIVEEIKKGAI